MHNWYIFIFILGILFFPKLTFAQPNTKKPPTDDLGNVEDAFQEHFFEALKQKGIENYKLAVDALQKCLTLNDNQPVIYFELGKNYNKLKQYNLAEDALIKAIDMQPDNEWFLDELYEVYYQQNDVTNAIATIKQLVKYHPDYKQDLATLYIKKEQYQQALTLLDELDAELGTSPSRLALRNQIYDSTGNNKDRIDYLKQQIAANPNNEDLYLKLIYRYSQAGQKNKAYQAAKQLLNTKPKSELVHLALYKFYLEDNKVENAINSVKIALTSAQIDATTKTKVLKDFMAFVAKNPQYEIDLVEITTLISEEKNAQTANNLGNYYTKTGNTTKALTNYKDALKQNPTDFKLIKEVLRLQIAIKDYKAVVADSQNALELYPAQPILYLTNGIANNKLSNFKQAIESLEMGLDFLIDNPKMEANFYSELSVAYKALNNNTKAEAFAKKAQQLKSQ